jgi:hypothetical protein
MSFSQLYDAVQIHADRVSTKWLTEKAIEHSNITRVKEQWSGVIDGTTVRGFYIEGPMGPPVPLQENEVLIVLARSMCLGLLGDHWRRFVKTKELMHVFDEPEEKTGSKQTFDIQIEKFGDPSAPMSPQFRAEQKAFWRALAVLCPRQRRTAYKGALNANQISYDVVATALHIPVFAVREMMRDDFEAIIERLK